MGGDFNSIGGIWVGSIAKWNGTAWSSLGYGMNDSVKALAVSGGDLYAAGRFTNAGGSSADYIAKWNGTTWSALGAGLNGEVNTLAISGTNLYAGGAFTSAGGSGANRVAKWDGSAWSQMGSGISGPAGSVFVEALAILDSNVYAGGMFTSAGGVSVSNIAKWNGSSWSALGSGVGTGADLVMELAVSGADIYAGGSFLTAGGLTTNNIAKWNGSAWSALGSGVDNKVQALVISGSEIFVGGMFTTAGGLSANRIARWDGTSWSVLGSGMNAPVNALAVVGGYLYAGGDFTVVGGKPSSYVARASLASPAPEIAVEQPASVELTDGTSSIDFGSVLAGSSNTPKTFTVRNTGTSDLTLTGVTKVGGNSGDFTVNTTGMATTVTPGGSTTFTVAFSPAATGARSTTLQIGSNDGDESPFDINLSGTGTATLTPEIAVEQPVGRDIPDGSDQDFGLVAVHSNTSLTFTIKNTGAADLTDLTITKDGPNAAEFTITAPPTAPVAGPNGSTTFTVQFTPASTGWKNATVHIANNDSDEAPFDIRLTGRGRSTMANFLGGDRFDDNVVNPAAWDSDIVNGGSGVLTEINQRLEYTELTGNSIDNSATRPWILNNGCYTANWEARLDVHLSNATLPNNGDERRIGLLIYAGNYGAETRFELENNNGTLLRRLSADDEDGFGTGRGDHATTSTDAALRVTFDAVTKGLTFYYDENGATGGYSWTLLFTTDIDAPGSNWGLNSTSRFQLALYGESGGVAVASGEVYADNLALNGLFVNPLTVDFDTQGHNQPVYDYLAQHGITITEETFPNSLRSMDHDITYVGPMTPQVVQATSLDKYLSAVGPPAGVPYSFRMNFPAPMWRVTVDNCGILVPSINASWSMTAYNALGQQVAQTQFNSPPATFAPSSFVLQPAAGETISSIVVANTSSPIAAFATGNWDTFTLYPNSSAEIGIEGPSGLGLTDGGPAVNFGSITTGVAGTPQTFTIRNEGNADLTGISVTKALTGTPGDFTLNTTGTATTLAPGATTSFTLTFAPGSIGAKTATVKIASNDADENPFEIAVTGTASPVQVIEYGPVVWGSQKFDIRDFDQPFTKIAAGYWHNAALKTDGTVVAWGGNDSGQATVPVGLSGIRFIATGDAHTVALRNDGTVVAWGANSYGQTTVPIGLNGVIAIAAGVDHTVAMKTDGTVVAWGGEFERSDVGSSRLEQCQRHCRWWLSHRGVEDRRHGGGLGRQWLWSNDGASRPERRQRHRRRL